MVLMNCTIAILMLLAGASGQEPATAAASRPSASRPSDRIAYFRLRSPDDKHDLEQGSDLHFGKLGEREGFWIACDRNGGPSAGRVYFVSAATLEHARPTLAVKTDDCFTIDRPAEGWEAFASAHSQIPAEVLDDLRDRVEAGLADAEGPYLDLEAITVAPSTRPPHEPHLFVAAEEPYSTILELVPLGRGPRAVAQLMSVHVYPEADYESGTDHNDGLEGLAWAGRDGLFYWAEEGTTYHGGRPGPRLFFRDPRVGRGRLEGGELRIEEPFSGKLTALVQTLRKGTEQTLNTLTITPAGRLLAVDRNGGWILRLDPVRMTAERWLNLYDLDGVDLRELLRDFPAPREMPYISIEGIAIDRRGDIWLIDDPALPEAFHASCLIRLRGFNPDPTATSAPYPNPSAPTTMPVRPD